MAIMQVDSKIQVLSEDELAPHLHCIICSTVTVHVQVFLNHTISLRGKVQEDRQKDRYKLSIFCGHTLACPVVIFSFATDNFLGQYS